MKNRTVKCWLRRAILRLLYSSGEAMTVMVLMRRLTTDFSNARFLALSFADREKLFSEVVVGLLNEGRIERVTTTDMWGRPSEAYRPRNLLEILAFAAMD